MAARTLAPVRLWRPVLNDLSVVASRHAGEGKPAANHSDETGLEERMRMVRSKWS